MAEVLDGNTAFESVNQAQVPSRIGDNQLSGAVNVSFVNGLHPRQIFETFYIKVLTPGGRTAKNGYFQSYQYIFENGKFQGAEKFCNMAKDIQIAIISGLIFRVDQDDKTAIVLMNDSIVLDEYREYYNMTQGSDYFYIHNIPGKTVIIDLDNKIRFAEASNTIELPGTPGPTPIVTVAPQVPPSNIGAYDQYRLVIGKDWNEFLFSDPNAYPFPQKESTFSEVFSPSGPRHNQSFSVLNSPVTDQITYMGPIPAVDNSTGIGGLIVANKNKVEAVVQQNLPTNDAIIPNFAVLLVLDHGIIGSKAATTKGFDFVYVSSDFNIRSLNTSRGQQGQWSNPSLSEEVKLYLRTNNQSLLTYSSIETIKNRIHVTVDPFRTISRDSVNNPVIDYAFKGFVTMETATTASMAGSTPPVWAGLWNQKYLAFRQFIKIGSRLYIWCKVANRNVLCELKDGKVDSILGTKYKITSRIYTRAIGRGSPLADKQLTGVQGELTSFDIRIGLSMTAYFKPSQAPTFYRLNSTKIAASKKTRCKPNSAPSGIRMFKIGTGNKLDNICDKATEKGYQQWRDGQIMLELRGQWELKNLLGSFIETPASDVSELPCEICADELNRIDCSFVSDSNLDVEESDGSC